MRWEEKRRHVWIQPVCAFSQLSGNNRPSRRLSWPAVRSSTGSSTTSRLCSEARTSVSEAKNDPSASLGSFNPPTPTPPQIGWAPCRHFAHTYLLYQLCPQARGADTRKKLTIAGKKKENFPKLVGGCEKVKWNLVGNGGKPPQQLRRGSRALYYCQTENESWNIQRDFPRFLT